MLFDRSDEYELFTLVPHGYAELRTSGAGGAIQLVGGDTCAGQPLFTCGSIQLKCAGGGCPPGAYGDMTGSMPWLLCCGQGALNTCGWGWGTGLWGGQ